MYLFNLGDSFMSSGNACPPPKKKKPEIPQTTQKTNKSNGERSGKISILKAVWGKVKIKHLLNLQGIGRFK